MAKTGSYENALELTVKILKIRTPEKFAVITLRFKQCGSTRVMYPKDADGMANSVDTDQVQSNLVYNVCPGLSVQKLRLTAVIKKIFHNSP